MRNDYELFFSSSEVTFGHDNIHINGDCNKNKNCYAKLGKDKIYESNGLNE